MRLCAILAAAMLAWSGPAAAVQKTFFGEDLGGGENTRLSVFAHASAAQAEFLSYLAGVHTESFEDHADGDHLGQEIGFSGAATATMWGSGGIVSTSSGATNGFGRYATDGAKYWESSKYFSIDFDAPVAAFGFMGIDVGDFGGRLTVTAITSLGEETVYTVPNSLNGLGGDVLFWGVIDTNKTFTSVVFGNTPGGSDVFGFDQMTIGSRDQVIEPVPIQPVPEPSTYLMLLAGLGLLGFATRHALPPRHRLPS